MARPQVVRVLIVPRHQLDEAPSPVVEVVDDASDERLRIPAEQDELAHGCFLTPPLLCHRLGGLYYLIKAVALAWLVLPQTKVS